ncbi:MAG: glycosyltransferase family 39 protein [Nitrospirae bacterium]|nr:glycosyltransferase family 39 protein [Nitrospirota bacterium]
MGTYENANGVQNTLNAHFFRRITPLYYIAALMAAFVVRSVLAVSFEGHPIDIGTFKAWAMRAASVGLSGFYSGDVFADYPPGYVYMFYLTGKIKTALSLSPKAFLYVVKLPSIIADIAAAHCVFLLARRNFSFTAAAALAAAYAFNPAVIVNSAVWGQVDAVFGLCVLCIIILIAGGRLTAGAVVFALAVLIKPQGLIFTPVLIFALSRVSLKKAGIAVCSAVCVFIAAIVPFMTNKDALWIVKHYYATLSSYPYASLNAFNLFALWGGNFAPVTDRLLGITYELWGYAFIVMAVGFCTHIYYKKRESDTGIYYFIAAFLITAVFVTSVKMHERYLFPGLALLLTGYVAIRDKRLLYIYAFISITFFINEAYVLYYAMRGNYHMDTYGGVLQIVSIAHVGCLVYLIKIGVDLYMRKSVSQTALPVTENETSVTVPLELGGRDYAAIAIITILNLAIMYYELGSLKAPETFWAAQHKGQGVYVDLGGEQMVGRVCFFGGIGDGQYDMRYSTDFQNWRQTGALKQKAVFEWQCVNTDIKGRYISLTAAEPGAMLNEIAFFDKDALTPLPVKFAMPLEPVTKAAVPDKAAGNIIDEQHTVPPAPSYMNSTYFDEIYHARTAYEYLHGLPVYETTHPPLGKVFIEIGIAVFGMNPFGWRVMGALFGAFIPAIVYVFGYRLFGGTRYALIASLLMTADFMRVAQGRMATVDTYAVFFIILMYYYMYRYWEAVAESGGKTDGAFKGANLYLGLSGLFFGLGVAVKWISVYAVGGLAVIFFASVIRRYIVLAQHGRQAASQKAVRRKSLKKQPPGQTSRLSVKHLHAATLNAIQHAALYFILIPAVIYTLSYIPTAKYQGLSALLSAVKQSQTDMYDYHKNLVAEHPFSSNWYEWPIMKRPLWLYNGNPPDVPDKSGKPVQQVQSIVSMGNPAVWWMGIVAVLVVLGAALAGKRVGGGVFVVLTGLCAQYLPWVAVPRLTFIYHFYASVPFVIFCITYAIKWLEERRYGLRWLTYAYISLTVALFIAFYPILTGITVTKAYVRAALRWFDSWIFYS